MSNWTKKKQGKLLKNTTRKERKLDIRNNKLTRGLDSRKQIVTEIAEILEAVAIAGIIVIIAIVAVDVNFQQILFSNLFFHSSYFSFRSLFILILKFLSKIRTEIVTWVVGEVEITAGDGETDNNEEVEVVAAAEEVVAAVAAAVVGILDTEVAAVAVDMAQVLLVGDGEVAEVDLLYLHIVAVTTDAEVIED